MAVWKLRRRRSGEGVLGIVTDARQPAFRVARGRGLHPPDLDRGAGSAAGAATASKCRACGRPGFRWFRLFLFRAASQRGKQSPSRHPCDSSLEGTMSR